jgi:hypothetical protein
MSMFSKRKHQPISNIEVLLNQIPSRMYLKSAFSALLLILSINLFAQQNHICINDQIQLRERKEINSSFQVPEFSENISLKYVNTVVHVIYFDDADSIAPETIETVIEDLNRLFRAEAIDTSLINPVHRDKLMDSQIQFCLSKTDPDGEPTTGITHTQTDVTGFPIQFSLTGITAELVKYESFGGVAPWDIDRYFNIWIAPVGLNNENFSYGIPREEYSPLNAYTPANTIPGAVVDIDNFKAPPPIGTLESLFAHECGHALGLLHTFHVSGIDTVEFCDGTDFMEDTPTSGVTTDCDLSIIQNTCVDPLNDEPDHVSNFMNFACQLMFTPDQIARMQNNLSLAPGGLFDTTPCSPVTSIEKMERENDFEFSISPNPNYGNFTVKFPQPYFSKGTLSIYNSMGQIIFEKNIDLNNSLSFPINIIGMKKGVYYLNVHSERGILSKKMVIQGS